MRPVRLAAGSVQCDGPFGAYLPTDLGRAQAYEMPRIRQAYRQAARNGESGTCRVLEGIAPDLKGTQEEFDVCDTCGATLDGEPDAFSECDECEERTQQTNRAQRPALRSSARPQQTPTKYATSSISAANSSHT